jgi:hypothetical protein
MAASNAAERFRNSGVATTRPLNDGITTEGPIRTVATVPAGAASFRYGTAFRASQPFAMSQEVVNRRRPTGSNRNEQSYWLATTVTGASRAAAKIAGLAAFVSCLKIGT